MSTTGKLRRIALDRQGLLKNKPFGGGKQAVLRAIEHLGYVQIDTLSVVERAHHHVLQSRVPDYRPTMLDQLVAKRAVFEYWFHAAAWLPMRDYRFALPRMMAQKDDQNGVVPNDKKLMGHILQRVREEGPLLARDFEDDRRVKQAWWDWKPAKRALEHLFMRGELMASGRTGFQKVYDLPERVLPDWVDTRLPTTSEYAKYLIDTTLRAHGFSTPKSITYLRKGQALRAAVHKILLRRLDASTLTTVALRNGDTAYIDPELLEARAPRCRTAVRILSPFDNAVIQRERGLAIFDFNYQIECYVPEKKRRFGYFCLPLVYRDRLVGRADCKAHRRTGQFELKSLYIEKAVDSQFVAALAQALVSLATSNGCDGVTIGKICPQPWRQSLQAHW